MRFPKLFVVTLAVLAAVRLSLAAGVERYVNRTLNRHEDYAGRIGDVRLDLWRGAYVIEGLELQKRSGEVIEPFLSAKSVDFSIQWAALFHGAIVGEVTFHHPTINFVLARKPEDDQTKIDAGWTKTLLALFPFQIDQIQVHDGRLRFRDLRKQPAVDVDLVDLRARLCNLTNIRKPKANGEQDGEELVTTLDAVARPLGAGGFWMTLRLDPFATRPTFDLNAAIEGFDLVALNDFLRAYANLDVERGTLHAYVEAAAAEGRLTGYVKPFLEDVEVVAAREIEGPGDLAQAAWEAAAGAAAKLLENRSSDQVATRIPIEGRVDDADTDIWSAVGTLLRNAFLRALNPGVEGSVTLGEAEEKQTDEEKETAEEDAKKKQRREESLEGVR